MSMGPINLYDYEARAKLTLPHNEWDTIEAGAMDMFTTRRNREAFEELTLRPRFLRDVDNRDISTTMLGEEISLPVFICPAGSHVKAHPDGELATARGAGMSNTLMMLSTACNFPLEDVSEAASGPLWFQLYHRGYDLTEMLVHRAEEAGFKAICLTVDTPVPSPKERDLRNAYVRHHELANFRGLGRAETEISGTDETPGWDVSYTTPITWKELEWLRSMTQLPAGPQGHPHRRGRPRGSGKRGGRHTGFHPRRTPVGHDYGGHRNAPRGCGGGQRPRRGLPGLGSTPRQ